MREMVTAAITGFVCCVMLGLSAQAWADQSGTEQRGHVLVQAVAGDQSSIDVSSCPTTDCTRMHLVVTDGVVKDQLKQFHKGDHVHVVYSTDKGLSTVKAVAVDAWQPPLFSRTWVLLASTGACLFLYCIFSGFKPLKLIIGDDNRYSNSQFQMAAWFFALITTYVATVSLRVLWAGWDFIGGVNIPQNLLLISGMSVLTFGSAKAITTSKIDEQRAAGNNDPKNSANATPNLLRDLTHNDGKAAVGNQPAVPPRLDFGDFQMLVITLIALATYIVLVFNFLGTIEYSKTMNLPDVDTTILAVFGLGHGAYLTKKAAGTVGQT
jgi:hypothetical protein